MRSFLVIDLFVTPETANVQVAYSDAVVYEDNSCEIKNLYYKPNITPKDFLRLIDQRSLIVRQSSTFYNTVGYLIPEFSSETMPCETVISVMRAYGTTSSMGVQTKFTDILNSLGIKTADVMEFISRIGFRGNKARPVLTVAKCDLVLQKDLARRYHLSRKPPKRLKPQLA